MSFGGTLAWSVQNISPCAAWDLPANPKPNTLGQWHTGDTGETLMDPSPHALRHISAWGQPRASLLTGKCGAGEKGSARPKEGAGMPTGRMHGNNTSWDREQGHTRAWTQSQDSSRPRGTARSLECHPPSLACMGWDVSLPQTPRQGLCLGLCPRGPAMFAPLLLPVATTSPPNISTAPASCDLPRSNPSKCPPQPSCKC